MSLATMILGKIKRRWEEFFKVLALRKQIGLFLSSGSKKRALLKQFRKIHRKVDCSHNEYHILSFVADVLALPSETEGCMVEAGVYKGGSLAKFSLVAKLLNRPLVAFDSFEGLPDNTEKHERSIFGHSIKKWFQGGKLRGSLEEVEYNVRKYGDIGSCRFIKGWFEETLPGFTEKIFAAYLDVDLASSTKTCLKHLYPRMVSRGILYSQDGDFPLVIDVFDDDRFWEKEVGCPKPRIEGLRKSKILKIVKP